MFEKANVRTAKKRHDEIIRCHFIPFNLCGRKIKVKIKRPRHGMYMPVFSFQLNGRANFLKEKKTMTVEDVSIKWNKSNTVSNGAW